jgi:hypothetical protein
MKPTSVFIAGMLLSAGAYAQEQLPLELPATSKMVPLKDTASTSAVEFSGTTAIHAILVAQWQANATGGGHSGQSFQLLPVPQSAAQIPHFRGAPLKFISVVNGMAILARATSQTVAAEFASRKTGVIHVEGIFTIKGLRIGSPCNVAGQAEVIEVDPVRVRFPSRSEDIQCPK